MSFDYIIVGAGSAGCVLANRLTEDADCRVLLIEAGGEADTRLSNIPGAASWMQNSKSDWAFSTTHQPELFDRRIAYPRGRVVGGSSILNYMVYIRGNSGDYDQWAQFGNHGWSYDDVLPYFIRAEANTALDDMYHGTGGPLSVETNAYRHPLCEKFIEAAVSVGHRFNPDFNGAVQAGCGYYQATLRNGRRCSTALAYLDPALARPNLTIVKEALVTRIIVEKGRAQGVEYFAGGRRLEIARTDGEVILAAGAIGSPHLLMLSGLGPADHLKAKSVEVVADLPGVGQDLQDHISPGSITGWVKDPDAFYSQVALKFDDAVTEFEETGGGLLATHYLDVGAFMSVDPGEAYPSLQTFFYPGISEFFRTDGVPDRRRFGIGGYVCRPGSRGSVTLASGSPLDPPIIDPNYFSDPNDLRRSIELVRKDREILNAAPFDDIRLGNATPDTDDPKEIATFIRQNALTTWHPTSSCRMGIDDRAVVGPDLRVKGLEGLSVCDASVMPSMVSGNINAPVIMIAEKGADILRSRRRSAAL
ncbi:GMC family oxidoreductase N-terminal domain-containing protein [Mesorhizobium sp. M0060]|uniref:GMC family oxidoreductase n=1 Tax=Mesorhizobium sp. M0060 TaxID=2956866 RepID=UPI00333B7BCB